MKSLPLFVAIVCLFACSPKKETKRSSGLIGQSNCLNIVNGQTTTSFPAVTLVVSLKNNKVYGTCTGTFIGPKTVLTAAHCITGDTIGISRATQFEGQNQASVANVMGTFVAAAKVLNNDPTINSREPLPVDARSDIAILIFNTAVASEVAPLLNRLPTSGDQATLVGFGNSSVTNSDRILYKRFGYNRVTVEPSVGLSVLGRANTVANAPAGDTTAAMGDSGGPLLIDGKVAGILAIYEQENNSQAKNFYGDMSDSIIRGFLQNALSQGADFVLPEIEGLSNSGNVVGVPSGVSDCLI